MVLTKGCATFGCMLILAQASYHLICRIDYPTESNGHFLFRVLGETLIGAFLLALPALMFFIFDEFREMVKQTAFLYPLFLAFGFWQANSVSDGFAYILVIISVILPVTCAYALLVALDGWSQSGKR